MFFVVQRATVLIPSGPPHNPDLKHLFVCMTGPRGQDREALVVPVNSVRPSRFVDGACLLFADDHPFIRAESFVNYKHARILGAAKIENAVNRGEFEARAIVTIELFARIEHGLRQSRFVAPKIMVFYESH